mgnify:CR=1 FL=1
MLASLLQVTECIGAYLWQETLVESSRTLLSEDSQNSRPRPVVLGDLASNLGCVLDSALDNVHGSVQDSADSATNGTRDNVVGDLALLGVSLGEHLAHLENAAEVTSVPENMAPHGTLETLVHGEDTLVLHSLDNTVNHAIVLSSRSLVLQTNLDELEGNDHKGLSSTSRGTSQDGQALGHLVDTEPAAVDLAPFIVGSGRGGTLGGCHENRSSDTTVEAGSTMNSRSAGNLRAIAQQHNLPLVLDDLAEAVEHAIVSFTSGSVGLQLTIFRDLVSIDTCASSLGHRRAPTLWS